MGRVEYHSGLVDLAVMAEVSSAGLVGQDGTEFDEVKYDPTVDPILLSVFGHDEVMKDRISFGDEETQRLAMSELAKKAFRAIGLPEKYASHVDFIDHPEVALLVSQHIGTNITHVGQDLSLYERRDREVMQAIEKTFVDPETNKVDRQGIVEFLEDMIPEAEEIKIRGDITATRARERLNRYKSPVAVAGLREAIKAYQEAVEGRGALIGSVTVGLTTEGLLALHDHIEADITAAEEETDKKRQLLSDIQRITA